MNRNSDDIKTNNPGATTPASGNTPACYMDADARAARRTLARSIFRGMPVPVAIALALHLLKFLRLLAVIVESESPSREAKDLLWTVADRAQEGGALMDYAFTALVGGLLYGGPQVVIDTIGEGINDELIADARRVVAKNLRQLRARKAPIDPKARDEQSAAGRARELVRQAADCAAAVGHDTEASASLCYVIVCATKDGQLLVGMHDLAETLALAAHEHITEHITDRNRFSASEMEERAWRHSLAAKMLRIASDAAEIYSAHLFAHEAAKGEVSK